MRKSKATPLIRLLTDQVVLARYFLYSSYKKKSGPLLFLSLQGWFFHYLFRFFLYDSLRECLRCRCCHVSDCVYCHPRCRCCFLYGARCTADYTVLFQIPSSITNFSCSVTCSNCSIIYRLC